MMNGLSALRMNLVPVVLRLVVEVVTLWVNLDPASVSKSKLITPIQHAVPLLVQPLHFGLNLATN